MSVCVIDCWNLKCSEWAVLFSTTVSTSSVPWALHFYLSYFSQFFSCCNNLPEWCVRLQLSSSMMLWKHSVFVSVIVFVPWSPTRMMLTQRCSFICLSPFINWPTILSITLSGLFNWSIQKESLSVCLNDIQQSQKSKGICNVSLCDWCVLCVYQVLSIHSQTSLVHRQSQMQIVLTSVLMGPILCPYVSGCSECMA